MSGDEAIADEEQESDWLAYGRTHNERRFSPSKDIDTGNVSTLKVDWFLDLPNDVGLVSTPLVIDGVMYFTGTMNILRAVDAASGKLIWEYDPEVFKVVSKKRQIGWVHNRGISFSNGKIFTGTWDGRLIAVDAKTGKELWSIRTFDENQALYITGAPKAFKDKVLIGNGGTENGPTRGYVTAYEQETGKQAWRFYIVPGNPADGFENDAMKMAATTWTGEWWKHGGGGNAWHGFTFDEELNTLYIGTGNGSPWNRKIRSPNGGDNLFLCSIVALNPDNGEYKWHYQTTPGESWDYNSNMDIVLADLKINNKEVKAILHAPKNGFFYVIDRETGKLLSAEPFVKTSWATEIDITTGRPIEVKGARYETDSAFITPNAFGAHSFHAMAYSPQTGLVYIPANHFASIYSDKGYDLVNWRAVPFQRGLGVNTIIAADQEDYPSSLIAWDPVTQKAAWSIPQQTPMNAGILTTGGNLVFQGRSDGKFLAYNARTGDSLLVVDLGLGIAAPPISYKVDGRQYIALLAGWGGGYAGFGRELGWEYGKQKRRMIAFSLEGTKELPKLAPRSYAVPLIVPDFSVNDSMVVTGQAVYFSSCISCHGPGAIAKGMAPDLRASAVPLNITSFADVVRNGSRTNKAMPRFKDFTDQQLFALMHFIRQKANEAGPPTVIQKSK